MTDDLAQSYSHVLDQGTRLNTEIIYNLDLLKQFCDRTQSTGVWAGITAKSDHFELVTNNSGA